MTHAAKEEGLAPPPPETVERWAWDYLRTTELSHKLSPPPPPRCWEDGAPARRVPHPSRPPELIASRARFKTPGPEALRSPERRSELLHTFLHHELQAAELLCWAILAFPETPRAFRSGLVGIARDEVRHMGMFAAHIAELGHRYGDFPVRDWFWERVPLAPSPVHFVAALGIGFEGANLDHTMRFAARLRAVGDEAGAALEEQIAAEEIPHVRFALRWFHAFTGRDDFATWTAHLPPPLSPMLMRGTPVHREGRLRSGFSEAFIDELCRWQP